MSNDVLVAVFNADEGGMDAALWNMLRGWLQPDERARADRYHDVEARASFLIGRGMARTMLSEATGVEPAAWQFREGPHGRPEIAAPDTAYRFNLAHSHGMVACALAHGRDVGVDVEFMDRPRSAHDVAARVCSPQELEDVNSGDGDERQERFLVYWTLKEAYLKACGLGISVHLADVAFVLHDGTPAFEPQGSLADADRRWLFRLAQPGPRHLMAVAVDTRDPVPPTVRFQRFHTARFPPPQ